jgi:hypothetical protein
MNLSKKKEKNKAPHRPTSEPYVFFMIAYSFWAIQKALGASIEALQFFWTPSTIKNVQIT